MVVETDDDCELALFVAMDFGEAEALADGASVGDGGDSSKQAALDRRSLPSTRARQVCTVHTWSELVRAPTWTTRTPPRGLDEDEAVLRQVLVREAFERDSACPARWSRLSPEVAHLVRDRIVACDPIVEAPLRPQPRWCAPSPAGSRAVTKGTDQHQRLDGRAFAGHTFPVPTLDWARRERGGGVVMASTLPRSSGAAGRVSLTVFLLSCIAGVGAGCQAADDAEEPDRGGEAEDGDGADMPDGAEDAWDADDADRIEDGDAGDDGCPYYYCDDCCCPTENGGTHLCGGCYCHPSRTPCDCCVPRRWECDTAAFIAPGMTAERSTSGFCGGATGLDSFWYEAPVVAVPSGGLDPCPPDEPCCRDVGYPVGFLATDEWGESRAVPFDTSSLPGPAWGCRDTGCALECAPPVGTVVRVHVHTLAWRPIDAAQFVVEEVCTP